MPARKKRRVGRPGVFKDAESFRTACETYFKSIESDNTPPTTSGLTLFLGLTSARRWYDQAERGKDFTDVVDWCREKIAHWHEMQVAGTASYSLGWLRKNRPEEWGDQPDVSVDGGHVAITINKVYG